MAASLSAAGGVDAATVRKISSVLDRLRCSSVSNFMPYREANIEYSAGSTALKGLPNQLIFDAKFEGGNLGRVECITEYEYDLYIRPDTCNASFRMWFNFSVRNVRRQQRVIFNIVNFSKPRSLFGNGMTPLVKSTSRPYWVRIPKEQVFYYRCPDHGQKFVLSISFAFDQEDDVYQFAYNYPYTYRDLQRFLDGFQRMKYDYFKRELIDLTTTMKNRLEMLTITAPHNLQGHQPVKTVLIAARIHPGETPASFVCEGLIEFLLGKSLEARILRDKLLFIIIPMVNPEGVVIGNYRSSLNGLDLNRHWANPSVDSSVGAIRDAISRVEKTLNLDVQFCIDIHGHSTMPNAFIYGNIYQGEDQLLEEGVYPKLLSKITNDFSWNQTTFNSDTVKAGTSRRYLGWCMGSHTHCYTLEVSFYGYFPRGRSKIVPYTPDSYHRLGRNVARAFLDYYHLRSKAVSSSGSADSLTGRLHPTSVNLDSPSSPSVSSNSTTSVLDTSPKSRQISDSIS